jgi:uncharacterized membrane protein
MTFKEYMKRFKNPGTLITVASTVVLLLTAVGVKVDNDYVMTVVKAVCSVGIALGVMNNPDTPGVDLPGVNKTTTDENANQ